MVRKNNMSKFECGCSMIADKIHFQKKYVMIEKIEKILSFFFMSINNM